MDSDTEPYTPEKRQEVQFLLCFFAEAITLLPCSVSWDLSTTGAVIYAMTRHYLGMEIWVSRVEMFVILECVADYFVLSLATMGRIYL